MASRIGRFLLFVAVGRADGNSKAVLQPGTALVVDNFISEEIAAALRKELHQLMAAGSLRPGQATGASMWQCTLPVGTHFPNLPDLCPEPSTETSRPLRLIAAQVLEYANLFLELNSSLFGRYAFRGHVFPDLALLRHYPGTTLTRQKEVVDNEGGLHLDTDFDGRCLSSVLFLNTIDSSGGLRLYGCPQGRESECRTLQGEKAVKAIEEKWLLQPENMVMTGVVQPKAGRLAFFLSDTIHSIAPFSETRDAVLVWASCHNFGHNDLWAKRNHKVMSVYPFNGWSNDAPTLQVIKDAVQAGHAVAFADVLKTEEAEFLHKELLEVPLSRWHTEGQSTPQRQFLRNALYCRGIGIDCPLHLGYLHKQLSQMTVFFAQFTKSGDATLFESWSGRGPRALVATWYNKGHFMSPHTDLEENCSLAFVYCLTKGWRSEWGGSFWWLQNGADEFVPSFNTLHIFEPSKTSVHMVSAVTVDNGRRFAVSGCFKR